MTQAIPVLWTNDDITVGQADKLQRQLDFLDPQGIPGVFFVIPAASGKTIADDPALLRTIEKARNKGHEFYQHGYVHTPYESGVPELWMLDFAPDVRNQFDEKRLELEAAHSFEALTTMIDKGRRIWRQALGEDSPGYRPGWGAYCGNLYRALAALGFSWVSSRLPCPTSWQWNQGLWDAPLNFRPALSVQPHRELGIMEYPIAGDYAFHVPHEPQRIKAMVELGRREFAHYCQEQAPMLIVCHWHGLERNGDSGYAVHKELLPAITASGQARWMGMRQLSELTSQAQLATAPA